jgi:hypothetical protein
MCLFAAFSSDRADAVVQLRNHWPDEMSLATTAEFTRGNLAELRELSRRTCSTISVLDYPEALGRIRFPVNRLRNIALKQCQSPYVLLHDIDFTVHPKLDMELLLQTESFFFNRSTRTAIVLPAFELHRKIESDFQWRMLRDKPGLDYLISKQVVVPFNMNSMPTSQEDLSGFYPGHSATDYPRWREAEDFYTIHYNTSAWPYYYEPYVLLRKTDVIGFDESFVHYGFNKISFLHELAAAGTEFVVHPNLFVVHTFDHEKSSHVSPKDLGLHSCDDENERSSFYKASIGHSCIGYFLRRMECAYNFGLASLQFSPLRNYQHAEDLYTDTTEVPCFHKCIYDMEETLRKPGEVQMYSSGENRGRYLYTPPARKPCARNEF